VSILDHLPTLERALIAAKFPAMTEWFRQTLTDFYGTSRKQLVLRVGRRGGKSSTLCRVAVLEALYGQHVIPPGDVGVVAIISVSRDEASQRLRTIRAVLDALKVKYRPTDSGGIELVHRPIAFKVYSASIAGVSGFTCVCAIADEVAKWRDADTGANPASEVLASLRPTLAGQQHARIFLSSSPLGSTDAHATAFDVGDTDFQLVAYAPTWVARPTLTEAETHNLEPDPRRWSREYLAVPQAGALGCFVPEEIERAFAPRPPIRSMGKQALVIDASSGRKDRFTFGIFGFEQTEPTILRFSAISGIEPAEARAIGALGIARKIALLGRQLGIATAHGDQRESFALAAAFGTFGVKFVEHVWTAQSKPEAVSDVRRWFREDRIHLPVHEAMRRELYNFEERITADGSFTFGARGSGHDDYVSLLITAAMVARVGTERADAARSFRRRADEFGDIIRRAESVTPTAIEALRQEDLIKARERRQKPEYERRVEYERERANERWTAHLARGDKDPTR
jgi:hypothetical protein